MKIYSILLAILTCLSASSYGQIKDATIAIHKDAFFILSNKDVQSKLKSSLEGFLKHKNRGSASNPYVDSVYVKKNAEPFVWYVNFEQGFLKDSLVVQPTLLAALPVEDSSIVVKIAYNAVSSVSNESNLALLVTLIAKEKLDRFVFCNAIDYNTRFWNKQTVGTIKYIYPNHLDEVKAQEMNNFNVNFAKKFNVPPLDITYYRCSDPEQLFKMMGYDYISNMYFSTSGGLAEPWHNALFAGNNSELYIHEAVHFYTSRIFPHKSRIVDEGYATFIGGSGGVSMEQLAIKAKDYLEKHPGSDLNELATNFKIRLEGGIPITYILSGIVCKDVEEKYGVKGILTLFNPSEGDDYFKTLSKINKVNRSNFPSYIKKLLSKY